MTQIVSAFQLGYSTVVTLPKELGIKPGQKLEIKKAGRKILLQKKRFNKADVVKMVEKLAGGLNLDKHLTPEEINRVLDEEYDDHKIMLPGR